MYKQYLALNNPQELICHKTQPTKLRSACTICSEGDFLQIPKLKNLYYRLLLHFFFFLNDLTPHQNMPFHPNPSSFSSCLIDFTNT